MLWNERAFHLCNLVVSFAWHSVAKHWFLGLPNIQTVSGLQGVAILDYAESPTASFVCIHFMGDIEQQESDPLAFAMLQPAAADSRVWTTSSALASSIDDFGEGKLRWKNFFRGELLGSYCGCSQLWWIGYHFFVATNFASLYTGWDWNYAVLLWFTARWCTLILLFF